MMKPSGTVFILVLVTFATLINTVSQATEVDGGWSNWSVLSSNCSAPCAGGHKIRVRSCTNPIPSANGKMCLKLDGTPVRSASVTETKLDLCNNQSCFDNQYGDWSNCSSTCGRGKRISKAMCGDVECPGDKDDREEDCNTWNRTACPSPCVELKKKCPQYGICEDFSDDEDPKARCVCTMGYQMSSDNKSCIRPPPTEPTPRPIPTLPPAQKVVATVISKTASTVIIICVSICLAIFFVLRIFTPDRVIQMNMEIALLLAHIILIFPPSITSQPTICTILSILVHFFFTACFMFMFLEALHMYAFVAFVVKKEGMFSRVQNTLVGWGIAAFIILFCMCFEYDHYGGEYHCWLQMDTALMYGQLIPIVSLVILTFTLIEAAGAADYKPLKGIDKSQLTSAKFSQRTNLVIMPLVFSHMFVGMLSEYEQNLPLYGVFSILNSVTGVVVLFFHCSNNQQVRMKLKAMYAKMCKNSGAR